MILVVVEVLPLNALQFIAFVVVDVDIGGVIVGVVVDVLHCSSSVDLACCFNHAIVLDLIYLIWGVTPGRAY